MGEHKGWRVRQDGKRHRAEVWIPELRRYRSKTFDLAKDAKVWARDLSAGVRIGAPSPVLTGPRSVLLEELAKGFLERLAARGRSPSHIANVKGTLMAAAKVAPDLLAPGAGLALEGWLDRLQGEASTRNRRLTELRSCIRWAMRRDLLPLDPIKAVERATVAEKVKPQFTLDELRRLLAVDHPYRRRVALMAYAGLRGDEAAAVTWLEMDVGSRVLLVRKHAGHRLKRNKERLVPIQDELMDILGPPPAAGGRVAPTGRNNPTNTFRRFLKWAGVPVAGRTPHSLRHTYAGLMTATGIPGALLKAYLGHDSEGTTQGYTKLAARFAQVVGDWPRGQLEILRGSTSPWPRTGWASPWPRKTP